MKPFKPEPSKNGLDISKIKFVHPILVLQPSAARIDAHEQALAVITNTLDKPENKLGLTQQEIADETGLSIATVRKICKASEQVLVQHPKSKKLWVNDWSTTPPKYRPKKRRGRPKTLKKNEPRKIRRS